MNNEQLTEKEKQVIEAVYYEEMPYEDAFTAIGKLILERVALAKQEAVKEYREKRKRKFECEFCGHKYVTQGEAYKRHISICYFNPERYCERCENTGTEMLPTLGRDLGIIPDGKEIPCTACATAKERGGYYYENEELKKGEIISGGEKAE